VDTLMTSYPAAHIVQPVVQQLPARLGPLNAVYSLSRPSDVELPTMPPTVADLRYLPLLPPTAACHCCPRCCTAMTAWQL
jgi:hypothetical protein